MKTFLALSIATVLFAQEPPPAASQPKGGHPAPKNLKILKPEEVMPMMRGFKASLGVQCTACHVQGDFASDEKPMKETARSMIVMNRDINSKFLDGKTQITCYTCHRGAEMPKTVPDAAATPPAGN